MQLRVIVSYKGADVKHTIQMHSKTVKDEANMSKFFMSRGSELDYFNKPKKKKQMSEETLNRYLMCN